MSSRIFFRTLDAANASDAIIMETCHDGASHATHKCRLRRKRLLFAEARRNCPILATASRIVGSRIRSLRLETMRIPRPLLRRLFQPLSLLAAVAALSPSSPVRAAGDDAGAAFLDKLSLNPAPSQVLTVCHGFDCTYRNQFVLTPARISYFRGTLGAAHSARDERKALGRAVAWFDRESGRAASTVGRIAYAGAATRSGPGQMDCIDLTANVTELLLVLERNKLLKFHRLGEPVSRGLIIDGKRPHTTPVIVEIANGKQWSVDSWTKAYGQIPDIIAISEWRNRD
jgi:hypothetical protein